MDKKEYKIRVEQIMSLLDERDFSGAMEVCDIIDWSRVKSLPTLCTVSEIYKVNREYEKSRDVLLFAYKRNPDAKHIVYALCELSIKLSDIVAALNYRNAYEELAPGSPESYILTYRIYEAQDVSLEERIAVLEAYKKLEGCTEKWSYELAYLYHLTGQGRKCAEECDEIALMYSEGKYVRMALELKAEHRPLTALQQEQLEEMDRIAAGEAFVDGDSEYGGYEEGEYPEDGYPEDDYPEGEYPEGEYPEDGYSGEEYTGEEYPETEYEEGQGQLLTPSEENEIEVRQLDPKKKDSTMNIQEELSKGIKEFFGSQDGLQIVTSSEDGEYAGTEEIEGELEASQSRDEIREEPVFDEESIWQKTGTMNSDDFPEELKRAPEEIDALRIESLAESDEQEEEELAVEKAGEAPVKETEPTEKPETEHVARQLAAVEAPAKKPANTWDKESDKLTTKPEIGHRGRQGEAVQEEPPRKTRSGLTPEQEAFRRRREEEMNRMLAQESSGQISMVVPEEKQVEEQITGQLELNEYVATWTRERKESQRKRIADAKRKSFEQTNNITLQLEGVLPNITDELPSTEEIEKNVTLPEEDMEKARQNLAMLKQKYTTGELPLMSALENAPELTEDVSDPGVEEIPEVAEYPGEEYPQEEDSQEEYPDEEYAQEQAYGEEYPDQAYQEEMPREQDPAVFDTSQIPVDEYSTEELPYIQEEQASGIRIEEQEEEYPAEELTEDYPEEYAEEYPEDGEFPEDQAEEYPEEDYPGEYADEPLEESYDQEEQIYVSDEELQDCFGSILQIRNMRERLAEAIPACSMMPTYGNILITGNEKNVRIDTANGIAKIMKQHSPEFTGRLFKIKAEVLNSKDIRKAVPSLNGGALLVEDAGAINVNTLDTLAKCINHSSIRMLIILETDKKDVKKVSNLRTYFDTMFDVRLELPTNSNNDLVEYAMKYARENEYIIEDMAKLALSKKIDELQTFDHPVTIKEVEEIMDAAMASADKFSLAHFKDVLLSKRYDKDDLIIIKERDFD